MNSGVKLLSDGLVDNSPLFSLNIGNNELTYQAITEIEKILIKCHKLRDLNISGN